MGLIGLLLAVGFVALYWKYIVGLVVVVAAARWWGKQKQRSAAEQLAEQQRMEGFAARADMQHAQIMVGDENGIWGDYPPAVELNRQSSSGAMEGSQMSGRIVHLDDFSENCGDAAVETLQMCVKLDGSTHRLWRITPNASGAWNYEKVYESAPTSPSSGQSRQST